MNKTLITLAATCGVALAAPAFAADATSETTTKSKVERNDDGSYSEKRSTTKESSDANRNTSSETTVKAKVDANGNSEKTVKSETVDDPNGMFNKKKTVVTDTEKNKDGTVETKHQKKVNGKTVEETTTESK